MRKPQAYRALDVRGEKSPDEWYSNIIYIPERGFVEPITNRDAEPVLGKILEWRYPEDPEAA